MAQPAEQLDDWVAPPSGHPRQGAEGVDDWVAPPPAASADGANDWVTPPRGHRRQPVMEALPPPSLRERVGRWIQGDNPYHSFWGRMARALVGSSGLGHDPPAFGTSGFGVSAADLFPPTGVLLAGTDAQAAAERGRPLEAVISAVGVIPAPGVNQIMAGGARTVAPVVAPSASSQVAGAAERLGVTATGAVDRAGADLARNIPTVVGNPVQAAAARELAELGGATERTLARASAHYSPADASRRGLADWLVGRGSGTADDVAETAVLRAGLDPPAPPGPRQAPGTQEIVTPDGAMTVRAQPELVELSELQLAAGRFQPRDRSRAEYARESAERANRLDPAQLSPGRVSDSGAPIVMPDGTIISGNGRIMSIAEVYSNPALRERAAAYRASLGTEAANMRQPVLIMRAEAMTPEQAARFADLSNRGRIATMSATERAARDANAIGRETIALYQGGEFTSPANQAFLRAFTERAVIASERPSFSSGATLTQEGIQRMRNAVLAGAYDDTALLARMLESTDDNIRALTGALTDAAPGVAQLRADIQAGVASADLDMGRNLTDAVRLIADLRSRGVSPASHFAQVDAFSRTDPLVEAWVRAFYNDELTRPISRQKMAEVVNAYTSEARKHAPGGLFADETTAGDVLNVAARARGTGDDAGDLLSGVPQPMGAGVRDGGAGARGSAVAGVGEAPPTGGQATQGIAGAADAGLGSAGQAGQRAISAEQSARIVTQNLMEARKAAMAKAVGLPVQGVTPEAITARLVEMARSRLPADVNGLIRARELIGNEGWRDVSAGILHRLGAREGGWDLVQFGQAWAQMTANGQRALFGGKGMPRGFQRALGDLALMSDRIPRLQQLTTSDLPPLIEKLFRSKSANILGQLILHPLSGGASLSIIGGQVTGWALAKWLARPLRAERASMWARAMAEFAKDVNPRSVAMLRFATTQLADMGDE